MPQANAVKTVSVQTRQLPCRLTEREAREFGGRLAHLEGELAQHTIREKDVKDELKSKRSSIEAQIHSLAGIIRQGEEYRPVDVRIELDYAASKMREVRQDTGAVIAERPMRDEERQVSAFTEDEPVRPVNEGAAPGLEWREDGGENRFAPAPGGTYEIERSSDGTWTADFETHDGKSRTIATGVTKSEAKAACERDALDAAGDEILKNAGDGELTKKTLRGPAAKHKKAR